MVQHTDKEKGATGKGDSVQREAGRAKRVGHSEKRETDKPPRDRRDGDWLAERGRQRECWGGGFYKSRQTKKEKKSE
jgi:hypothetical protein